MLFSTRINDEYINDFVVHRHTIRSNDFLTSRNTFFYLLVEIVFTFLIFYFVLIICIA